MKRKTIPYLFFLLAASAAMFSCQNRPREVLSRKNMERLMYDVYIAEATMENDYHNFGSAEKKEAYIQEVFRKHKVSSAQWDTSLAWYSDKIDIYLKMNDSVKARLQREQRRVEALVAAEHAEKQQNSQRFFSLSYIPSTFFFTDEVRCGFRFRLDSAEIASRITDDNFSFSFDVVGITPAMPGEIKSVLKLQYADTTIYRYAQIRQNQTYSLAATKYIEDDTLKQIGGFVHLQPMPAVRHHIGLYNIMLGNRTEQSPDSIQPEMPLADFEQSALLDDSLRRH